MPDSWRVFETHEFLARVRRMDARQRRFIEGKLKNHIYPQLREQPFYGAGVGKLRGHEPETWRCRIGRFRVFYAIEEKEGVVAILTVDWRKDAHR